jgi:transposase-like protein
MPETRRRYDPDFRAGVVGIVRETNKSVAEVAWELGINLGTVAHWVAKNSPRCRANDAPHWTLWTRTPSPDSSPHPLISSM